MAKPPDPSPTKPSLILPDDPAFYELPPPPGSEPQPSFEDLLADTVDPSDEIEPTEPVADDAPPVLLGGCDSHIHVFPDPERFPHADAAPYRPATFSAAAYRTVRSMLGLERAVIVQSSVYGFDHRALLDALGDLGAEDARGVAGVGPDTSDDELVDLDAAGCVATRFQMRDPWRLVDWSATDRLANRVHDLVDWNVELQMDSRFLMEVEDRVRAWPGQVVLDHVGCFLGPVSERDPGMRALLRLIDADKLWVKLSGLEEIDPDAPHYRNAERLARLLIRFAPERLVWGSNWPHLSRLDAPPDGPGLLALLGEWCEDDGLRRRILVDNPAELWRFPAPSD